MPLLNHMDTQGKALWETIIGREPENNKNNNIIDIFMLYYVPFGTPLIHY